METRLVRILSILILVTFVLTPGWLRASPAQRTGQPASPQAIHAQVLGTTMRVSIASDGSQGNYWSTFPSISADGRYAAFLSGASNLVSGDTNGYADVFVHDRQTGVTQRVSIASDGSQANDGSYNSSISASGRYVTFDSRATNLVTGDTNDFCNSNFPDDLTHDPPPQTIMTPTPPPNNCGDVFVHDRQTGVTQRVSIASDGSQGGKSSCCPTISADGRYVAFLSGASNLVSGDTNGYGDVFVHDQQTGVTQRVSIASDSLQGNRNSYYSSISNDGRYVTFESDANNLVSGDTNGYIDIFVHDRQTGVTQRVSIASDGSQGNSPSYDSSISADGRYVTFYSYADNLVSGDTNGYLDVFVHDRQTGVTQRVSIAGDGSQGNYPSYDSSISADGRYVTFESDANNLVSGDTNGNTDVLVHDRQTGGTLRVSIANDGSQGNNGSGYASISANGRYVVFGSDSSNLVSGDINGYPDVFVHDRGPDFAYIFRLFLPLLTY